MILKTCMLINNDCYIANELMVGGKPSGIVVHSTGANNKTLKRYVQPDKNDSNYQEIINDIGVNSYKNSWNRSFKEIGREVCVHAFIGVNKNNEVETYQTLPFNISCRGSGSGPSGTYNNCRVQFEICEDALTDVNYFNKVMKEAQEFCAYICNTYNLTVDDICSHKEACDNGFSSNRADPEHWMKKFGKTMDWFRNEVKKLIKVTTPTVKPVDKTTTEKTIWEYLVKETKNCYGAAGLMGNLFAESSLIPTNLQNSYEKKSGYNDSSYTTAVDNNIYNDFVSDKAGYGLAQWSDNARKGALLAHAKSKGKSVGDLELQLSFIVKELNGEYSEVLKVLKNATSVLEASNIVLTKYKKATSVTTSVKNKRAEYGQTYYDKYASSTVIEKDPEPEVIEEEMDELYCKPLNDTEYRVGDEVNFKGVYHYTSTSPLAKPKFCKPCKAIVTVYYKQTKTRQFNVHLKCIDGTVGGVNGFVDPNDIEED